MILKHYLIVYDLEDMRPDPDPVFRAALRAHGWRSTSPVKKVAKEMPGRTLRGSFVSDDAAVVSFREAAAEATARLRKMGRLLRIRKVYISERRRIYFQSDEDA